MKEKKQGITQNWSTFVLAGYQHAGHFCTCGVLAYSRYQEVKLKESLYWFCHFKRNWSHIISWNYKTSRAILQQVHIPLCGILPQQPPKKNLNPTGSKKCNQRSEHKIDTSYHEILIKYIVSKLDRTRTFYKVLYKEIISNW